MKWQKSNSGIDWYDDMFLFLIFVSDTCIFCHYSVFTFQYLF